MQYTVFEINTLYQYTTFLHCKNLPITFKQGCVRKFRRVLFYLRWFVGFSYHPRCHMWQHCITFVTGIEGGNNIFIFSGLSTSHRLRDPGEEVRIVQRMYTVSLIRGVMDPVLSGSAQGCWRILSSVSVAGAYGVPQGDHRVTRAERPRRSRLWTGGYYSNKQCMLNERYWRFWRTLHQKSIPAQHVLIMCQVLKESNSHGVNKILIF